MTRRVSAGNVHFGELTVQLQGEAMGRGILGWKLANHDSLAAVDGIPCMSHDFDGQIPGDGEPKAPSRPHPNGVTGVDHVVIRRPCPPQ